MRRFAKSFTQQEAISDDAIASAVAVLKSGRLHRYNLAEGEAGETALLESEFAASLGVDYSLACASGGYALQLALRACGLEAGDRVLCNAFTLSPVPGSIVAAGGETVLVDIRDDTTVDPDDLDRAARESGARFFVLSHMRGHIGDMDAIVKVCRSHEIVLIEDCAHTMGAAYDGRPSGTFGKVGCFSTQTYKHVNSGEGGLLATSDAEVMRRAVILSGSYMLFDRHLAAPAADSYSDTRLMTPNMSGRMDNLRAAILRPQLAEMEERKQRWNALYRRMEQRLGDMAQVQTIVRPEKEDFVGSSIQFRLPGLDAATIAHFVADCEARGIPLKWYGKPLPEDYTSRYDSWGYLRDTRPLPVADRVLATLCDLRLPLTFDQTDCDDIVALMSSAMDQAVHHPKATPDQAIGSS
ncbi:aminotransferase class I/II-fold pyridoxal phosphate-dependent enzyme [Halomonas denitrificans]|uniref:DegT/DnrJ/EryC1/StrS family aminotransferase n=1 Tax=Halomonas denitrificans TaxID=370769 RepID=UPI001CD2B3A7|nr:aminotransferase class I/II-fold pyridoxal phosphate-dependent enzyme [Halomonas denitrificans]MCA0976536.1 aminotransferase class I/II-fold pyridoxal phosphate-dependent enzyme [Halomonas denitrificans]